MDNLDGETLSILPTVSWREQTPTCHERCGLLSTAHRLASPREHLQWGRLLKSNSLFGPEVSR